MSLSLQGSAPTLKIQCYDLMSLQAFLCINEDFFLFQKLELRHQVNVPGLMNTVGERE